MGGLNSMRDTTTKNKRISELVKQEIARLDTELDRDIASLKIDEQDILDTKKRLEKLESNIVAYKSNIDDLKEQIEVLK